MSILPLSIFALTAFSQSQESKATFCQVKSELFDLKTFRQIESNLSFHFTIDKMKIQYNVIERYNYLDLPNSMCGLSARTSKRSKSTI